MHFKNKKRLSKEKGFKDRVKFLVKASVFTKLPLRRKKNALKNYPKTILGLPTVFIEYISRN